MADHPRPGRLRRRLLRILAVLGIGVLLGTAAGGWWAWHHGEAWLERTVRERIATMVDEASVPGYAFHMEELVVDTRKGQLLVTGAELGFEEVLLDSLRSGQFRYLFAARAGRIELRGISFWRLLVFREFRVEAFELQGPEIRYLIGGQRVDLADPFARLDAGSGPAISFVQADTFTVRGARARVEDLRGELPVLGLEGLHAEAHAVRITTGALRSGVRLQLGGAELAFGSLVAQLPHGDLLTIGGTVLSRTTGRGLVQGLHLAPAPRDTTDRSLVRRPITELVIDSILLSGFDVDHLIAYQALRIGHLQLLDARLNVELDKTLPKGDPVLRPLPTTALREWNFMVQVDTLTVHRASALYRERDAHTRRWGTVPFHGLDGRFLHVTNFGPAIAEHPRMEGTFSGWLFGSAQVSGTYMAELDGSDRFTVEADAQGLMVADLNSATRPLLRMELRGGQLQQLRMRMEGDDRRARGELAVRYSDLLVRVEPGTPRELRHSMFGSVIETMLKEAYGGGLSADRESRFSIDRDPHRSLITYIWHGTREGLARNLAPEAWERMRLMLRTDAEQRRELRELRRQRRQERREKL